MGMPTEGNTTKLTILKFVRDVPTCVLGENPSDAKTRVPEDWNISVVLDPKRIVLGLLDFTAIQDLRSSIEDVMKPAPATLRPSLSIDGALEHFAKSNRMFALVTKSTGELMGAVRKQDLEKSEFR